MTQLHQWHTNNNNIKSMLLMSNQDGYLRFGSTRGGSGRGVEGAKIGYNKGDVLLVFANGSADQGFKHSVYGKDHTVRRLNYTIRQCGYAHPWLF